MLTWKGQWFIYNFGLLSPGTRCFQYQWVPTANLWVQNTIFNDKSAVCNTIASQDSPGLAEIKTYAQKMQDVQVTKSLKGVCEHAEHVKSPQKMEYDVTMKTQTNLCRKIGALNGVSIHKNVSCGSVYNTETEKCTTLIEMYYTVNHVYCHPGPSHLLI